MREETRSRHMGYSLRLIEIVFICTSPQTGLHIPRPLLHQFTVIWKEGIVLFNDTLNTFYLPLCGVKHMVKDHSDSEREETRCLHIGYYFRLAARVLSYASSHRQDNTYHGLCYTSRGELAGTRNSSMGPPHEGSIRRPIAPASNALTTELHLAPFGG